MDRDSLALLLARGLSVEEIGRRFDRHPSTVSYWLAKHGLQARGREQHAARGGIEEQRLRAMVRSGMTIAQIADELGRSRGTVRHWLGRYGLHTTAAARARAGTAARQAGKLEIQRECMTHGLTSFIVEGRGYYRCKRCRQERVAGHRRGVKRTLVAEAGGACLLCGYDRYAGALQFHHVDPAGKRMNVNAAGATVSIETLRVEAAKCVLLCANCHAEGESGHRTVPLK